MLQQNVELQNALHEASQFSSQSVQDPTMHVPRDTLLDVVNRSQDQVYVPVSPSIEITLDPLKQTLVGANPPSVFSANPSPEKRKDIDGKFNTESTESQISVSKDAIKPSETSNNLQGEQASQEGGTGTPEGHPSPRPANNQVSVFVQDQDFVSRRFQLPKLEIGNGMHHSRSPASQADQPGEPAAQTAPVLSLSHTHHTGTEARRGSLPVVPQPHFLFPLYNPNMKSVDACLDHLSLSQYATASHRIPFPSQTTRRRSADPSELYRSKQSLRLGLARSGSASPNPDVGDEILALLEHRRASSGSSILSPVLESLLPTLSLEQLSYMSTISEMGSTCSLQVQDATSNCMLTQHGGQLLFRS